MMMGKGDMMMMGGGWGVLIGWLLVAALALVVLVILFRLFRRTANKQSTNGMASETPLATLQRRFALGEINAEQLALMKKQLAAT